MPGTDQNPFALRAYDEHTLELTSFGSGPVPVGADALAGLLDRSRTGSLSIDLPAGHPDDRIVLERGGKARFLGADGTTRLVLPASRVRTAAARALPAHPRRDAIALSGYAERHGARPLVLLPEDLELPERLRRAQVLALGGYRGGAYGRLVRSNQVPARAQHAAGVVRGGRLDVLRRFQSGWIDGERRTSVASRTTIIGWFAPLPPSPGLRL